MTIIRFLTYFFLKSKNINIKNKLIIAKDLDNPVVLGTDRLNMFFSCLLNNCEKFKLFKSWILGKKFIAKEINKNIIEIQKKYSINISVSSCSQSINSKIVPIAKRGRNELLKLKILFSFKYKPIRCETKFKKKYRYI